MNKWQVQEAKAHFSEMLEQAQTQGPQVITRYGVDHAFVVSAAQYDLLQSKRRTLLDVLLDGPIIEDLDIERTVDPEREIEWE